MAIQFADDSFRNYPPAARQLAEAHRGVLQQLPIIFVGFLLKELIDYDWNFPAEQRFLQDQLTYLEHFKAGELWTAMKSFRGIHLSGELEGFDWVNSPAQFLDKLSAFLWATHQIDAFHTAAEQYIQDVHTFRPQKPLPTARISVMIIGQEVSGTKYRLFRKLRRLGAYFTRLQPANGCATVLQFAAQRASQYASPFAHWYIDGGKLLPASKDLTCVSYHSLRPVRAQVAKLMQNAFESTSFGPEALRTTLTKVKAEDFGLFGSGANGVLNRFQVKLLTEGAGTQVFSTTFVQWATREVYRRAEPLTLVARFAPRARNQDLGYLLASIQTETVTDPEDSLIDADMGAWYAWLNQQRLSEADRTGFLVWYEDHEEAVAVGRSFAPGTTDNRVISMAELLSRMA